MTEDQLQLLDDLMNSEDCNLSTWEIGFLENLDGNWRAKELTPKQSEILVDLGTRL